MSILKSLAMAVVAFCTPASAAPETWVEPRSGMEFVRIAKACFQMGLAADALREETGIFRTRLETERPAHEVCLDEFWIGRFEVKVTEWHAIMGGTVPPAPPAATPAIGVTWDQAQAFARRLTEQAAGPRFRLPTEAEWEHACRAGKPSQTVRIPYLKELDPLAWYSSSHGLGGHGARVLVPQPVGGKRPNAFGLHDILGNAWEWVADSYVPQGYRLHSLYNPQVEQAGAPRVIRGGGIRSDRSIVRCEMRGWMPAEQTEPTLGLRLVMTR
jgi:formylglycine-generating enzyme required for sulfatase activity